MNSRTNWSGNYTYRAAALAEPESMAELAALVRGSHAIKAIGTRHAFNDIADTDGTQVSLARLVAPPVIEGDTVIVSAASRYGDVGRAMQDSGRALHNMASLPHICVAGAIATATHGSGTALGNLSTAVRSLEILRADGELVVVDRSHPDFSGVVVGLGALGVVTRVTLATEPSYEVSQTVLDPLPWAVVEGDFEELMAGAYSVSLFTDWGRDGVQQVLVKSRLGAVEHHQPGQPGLAEPWNERLPHFRLESTPSYGEEIQTEYLLPLGSMVGAIEALLPIAHRFRHVLLVSEIRTVAADDLWMSNSYGRDSVGIHFTWRLDQAGVESVLPMIEEALAPFDPRPHWGKVFTMRPTHPRLDDFRELVERWDPRGVFRNANLRRLLG